MTQSLGYKGGEEAAGRSNDSKIMDSVITARRFFPLSAIKTRVIPKAENPSLRGFDD
jgi:hypothetical protein